MKRGASSRRAARKCLAAALFSMGMSWLWQAVSLPAQAEGEQVKGSARTSGQVVSGAELPALLQALKNPDPEKRARAAVRLGQAGSPTALKKVLPALVLALKDDSVAVRLAAIAALGNLGQKAEEAVPALASALHERSPIDFASLPPGKTGASCDVSGAVLDALEKIGPKARKALPYVIVYLTERNELYRRDKVLKVLGAIGPDESAAPIIMRVVEEEGRFTQTRRQAIRLLGKVRPAPREAIQLLSAIIKDDPDAVARRDAATVLEYINRTGTQNADSDPEVATLGKHLLPDQDMDTRLKALYSIQDLGIKAKSVVPSLIPLLRDEQFKIKLETIDALAAIGPDAAAAIPALVSDSLTEPAEDKRLRSFRAIARIDPDGSHTIPLLGSALEDPFRARNAVVLLETIATEETNTLAQSAKKAWKLK